MEFFDDAASFLAAAGEHLALDPVLNTVVATVAERERRGEAEAVEGLPHWYAVARSVTGGVDGVAMRTAPFRPYPLFVLPMPGDAAVALARRLHERGEEADAANGALPAVSRFAEESARLSGGTVVVDVHTRLFELRRVIAPRVPSGALRVAREEDADLALSWFLAFHHEAAEQAGRAGGSEEHPFTAEQMLTRIRGGRVFLWEVDGERVHLTTATAPSYGAARIGPVFTPKEHRGNGYASSAVAQVSQLLLDEGARPCLFTDQANPVSNGIYQAIGYERVVDMANLVVGRAVSGP